VNNTNNEVSYIILVPFSHNLFPLRHKYTQRRKSIFSYVEIQNSTYTHTERHGVAVTLFTRIRKVLGSSFGMDIDFTD
jgi:hypothetical protein